MLPETRATSFHRDDPPDLQEEAAAPSRKASGQLPSRNLAILRWSVLLAASAGFVFALVHLQSLWSTPDISPTDRLNEMGATLNEAACFFISCLIAWRGAHQAGNLWIALWITVVCWNGLQFGLLPAQHSSRAVHTVAMVATFFLGAGAYIRASQQFPQTITPAVLAASPSICGRVAPLRMVFTALLSRPILVWIVIASATAFDLLSHQKIAIQAVRLTIVTLGIAYFYVSYRSDNDESRRKVLWFLAAAVCALAFDLIGIAVESVLKSAGGSAHLGAIISLTLDSAYRVALVACIAAAVFYAGAISPTLVIRKTLVYGVSVALFLFAFASVEAFVAEHLVDALHVTDHFASALIGGTFGLTFHPVKRWVERLLERFDPKHRLEARAQST